jgi:hypothetical protein
VHVGEDLLLEERFEDDGAGAALGALLDPLVGFGVASARDEKGVRELDPHVFRR